MCLSVRQMAVKTLQFKARAIDIGKPAGLQASFKIVARGSGSSLHAVVHSVSGPRKTVQVCFDSQAITARRLRRYMIGRNIKNVFLKEFVKRHRQSIRDLPVYWATCKQCPIPPRSVVRLVSADEKNPVWRSQIGTTFRIGYYNRNDGLNTIWLVDRDGSYCQTTDLASLRKHFRIVSLASETDLYGKTRARLRALTANS